MKKWFLLGTLSVAIVLVFWLNQDDPVSIQAVQVELGEVRETVANTRSGSVKACRRSKLSVSMGGQIERVFVHEGDKVEAGQLLLTLFNQDIQAQRLQAKAHLSAVELQQDRQCIIAGSDLREAARKQSLVKKGLATAEDADLAKAKADASDLACQAAQADVNQAKAQVQLSQAVLSKTQLIAPFAGIVAEVNGEVGEYATPSPPGILTLPMVDLIDNSCYYVSAPIDEVDAARLTVGMSAIVSLDAFRDKPLVGKVRRVAPYVFAAEKQARTVEVEADVEVDTDTHLLVGYSADMEILIESREQALRIPTEAIFDNNKVYVFAGDKLHLREVVRGLSNWQSTEIRTGLTEGEWVLISASQSNLSDGVAATKE
ncbi:MAG: HlyD family secretion protein [Paraglaciecola sp.]|jgi:HlyD family secretion protein